MSQEGLFGKYLIKKADGSELDPEAQYFVIRYDDAAAHGSAGRAALLEYARLIKGDCPELCAELALKLRHSPGVDIKVKAAYLLMALEKDGA
jgi:hypothetical protein